MNSTNSKKIIRLELKPSVDFGLKKPKLNRYNLNMLQKWWTLRLQNWGYLEIKNLIIKPNYNKETLIICYDYPENDTEEDIQVNNEMISSPDDDGNYPIYIKDGKIVSIDTNVINTTDELVSSKLLKTEILNETKKKKNKTVKNNTGKNSKTRKNGSQKEMLELKECGQGKIINPLTGRCILLSGTIGKKLTKVPYKIIKNNNIIYQI